MLTASTSPLRLSAQTVTGAVGASLGWTSKAASSASRSARWSFGRKCAIAENALTELAWLADPAAPVGDPEIVEQQQFPGPDGSFDLYVVDAQTAAAEEFRFILQARELRPAKKGPGPVRG